MTGPVEFECEGRFDPALFGKAGARMSVDVVTFGCRLNATESEAIRRAGSCRRHGRRRGGQHLRGHRRGGAPGAPGDPQAQRERPGARIVVTGCAAQIDPRRLRRHAGGRSRLGNEEKLSAAHWAALDAREENFRRRHHGGEGRRRRTASTASKAAPAPSCRCRTAATTAAPSASSRSAAAIRARCRRTRWWRRRAGWSSTATARSC